MHHATMGAWIENEGTNEEAEILLLRRRDDAQERSIERGEHCTSIIILSAFAGIIIVHLTLRCHSRSVVASIRRGSRRWRISPVSSEHTRRPRSPSSSTTADSREEKPVPHLNHPNVESGPPTLPQGTLENVRWHETEFHHQSSAPSIFFFSHFSFLPSLACDRPH